MKPVTVLQVVLLAAQALLVSSYKTTDMPDEGVMKWNIDLNDMLKFKKSFMNGDTGEETEEEQEAVPVEYQLEALKEQLILIKKLNKLRDQSNQYIKRYLNLFLVKCSLQNVPESDEDLSVNLVFSITKDDLIFLQNLSKDISQQNLQDNLYRLDKILDKGLQMKEESIYSKSWSFVFDISQLLTIPASWYYSKLFYYVLVLTVTLALITCFKYRGMSNWVIVLTIINNLIILEGFLNYLNQLKEAEIADHVRSLKVMRYSDFCDPAKQSIWSKVREWFTGDECLNYHMTTVNSKTQEVSPLLCILDAYNVFIFQYLFKVFGSAIRVFGENLYEGMPFKGFWVFMNNIWILPFILGIIFILLKPSMRFSFFGTSLFVGFPQRSLIYRRNEDEGIEYERLQEIDGGEERDIARERTESTLENDPHTKAEAAKESTSDKPIECIGRKHHSKVDERSGNIDGPNRTLLEDITTARNIVKDIKKSE